MTPRLAESSSLCHWAAAAACVVFAAPCQAQRKPLGADAVSPPALPRLALELQQLPPPPPPGAARDVGPRGTLEFRSAAPAAGQWTRGLLRVQLSGDSALLLRPRSGGVALSWHAKF